MAKPTNEWARFSKATPEVRQRLVALSTGEVASGKTSFWLGAPGPIVIQTLDQGLEGVVEPFTADKDIYVATYDLGQEVGGEYTHELAVLARDKYIEDFEHAIRHARTIIWDRESDMWPMFSYAEHGSPDAFGAATGKDWDKLKGGIRRLIAMAKASDVNFGIIEGMKNEWTSRINPKTGNKISSPSGNRIPSGMDDIDALVHITLHHRRETVNKASTFYIDVGKSRGPGGREVQDQTFSNLSFSELAQLIFPQSDESDWT